MQNPFKFYKYEDQAYIYDTNQDLIFKMGVEASEDVEDSQKKVIIDTGEIITKEEAWDVCGLSEI